MTQITHMLTPADMRALRRYGHPDPVMKRVRRLLLISVALHSAWRAITEELEGVLHRIIYFIVMFGPLCLFIFVICKVSFYVYYLSPTRPEDHPGELCEHTITLMPEALIEKTAINETKTAWSGIRSIVETANHFFIFVSISHAHVFPKRAFARPEAAEDFINAAHRYREQAIKED